MQLVKNGTPGILVNADAIKQLTTTKLLDQEINRVATGGFDPVIRRRKNSE